MIGKTILIAGGLLEEDFVLKVLQDPSVNFIIAVDRGLEFLHAHKINPQMIVGDFDSATSSVLQSYEDDHSITIYRCNPIKDASDTEIALTKALEYHQTSDEIRNNQIIILGGTGHRLDHFWGNVQSLKLALDAQVEIFMLDRRNRIRLIKYKTILRKESSFGKYFSLFPLGSDVPGLSIKGAKYDLTNYTLSSYTSRCISNEYQEDTVEISFPQGVVVLMETCD